MVCKTDKKTIHWIRHGEAFSNTSDLNYQIVDPGLTQKGIEQSKGLRDKLKSLGIYDSVGLVVTSPLARTLQTYSCIFGELGYLINVISLEELRERIDNPCHKRKDITEKKKQYPYVNFSQIPSNTDVLYDKSNGNEPESNLIKRINKFIRWLGTRREKNIVVITHGNFLYPLFNKVLLKSFENLKNSIGYDNSFFSNCELRTLVLDFNNLKK
jgi:broad specificity phosphatase PhoE